MANKKISDLTAASALDGNEFIELLQGGASVKGELDGVVKTYFDTLYGITSATVQATTSGTSIDFTSIPSTVKRITIMFSGVSTNGTSYMQVQLGDSGGVETSGYSCQHGYTGPTAQGFNASTGFALFVDDASDTHDGTITLTLLDGSTNTWTCVGRLARPDLYAITTAGSKSLSATLDRIRLTTVNGTDAFDAGKVNILYE